MSHFIQRSKSVSNLDNDTIAAFHASPDWIDANWRRKIRLADKTWQRMIAKAIEDGRFANKSDLNLFKMELTNLILEPLRLVVMDERSPKCFLFEELTNNRGRYLSKLARKKEGWIFFIDLQYSKDNALPFHRVVFRRVVDFAKLRYDFLRLA